MTEEQKEQALKNASRSLEFRQQAAKNIRRNSFEAWGNDKCISRTIDTLRAMKSDRASDAQYRYWLNN